jgi:hypothetical protein
MNYTFPKAGDKLIFTGVPKFFYPQFTNIGDYANKHLVLGSTYIASKVQVHSSWCSVELEGYGENFFNLSFFKQENE